ncbi:Aquaporin-1 [Vermiconidia calcicola]|uniref:Aquaporin-1 n=1 Tax=Vermiconidia calcicola TaxID=1690605 RepID=A0ACC3MP02_9PEZI|nr:Aquaporin-1 [Vermiconidia calcicola]
MNINQPSSNFIQLPFMKRQETTGSTKKELRLPFIGFLPNKVRNHFIAMVGEFCGTFLFLFFAFAGTQVANAAAAAASDTEENVAGLSQRPNAQALMYISLAFGFSLAVNVWVFFRISGGLFNPAVTLGLAMIGAITWMRAVLVFIAEMIASMCAAGVVAALFPGPMGVSTTLGPSTSIARGLFIEMFLTAELVFTIFMLAAEKHKGTFLAPIGIGLSLFVAELAGVYFTGGSLNPARSFGPCVALRNFPTYHWIYWVGPCLGTLIAVGFYRFIKIIEYETANPGQDFNEKETEVFNFDEDNAATGQDVARPSVAVGHPEYISDKLGTIPSRNTGLGSVDGMGSASSANMPPGSSGRMGSASGTTVAPESAGRLGSTGNANTHPGYTGAGGDSNPTTAYRNAPQAEAGDLGCNYRPSSEDPGRGARWVPASTAR